MKKKVEKVLMIDDDTTFEFIFKKTLELGGISSDVVCKHRATEALNFLSHLNEDEYPDVIFLDINMPIMNGFQFLEAYRNKGLNQSHKNTIIAMLSSSIYNKDNEKAKIYDEVKDFIIKPIDLNGFKDFCEKHSLLVV